MPCLRITVKELRATLLPVYRILCQLEEMENIEVRQYPHIRHCLYQFSHHITTYQNLDSCSWRTSDDRRLIDCPDVEEHARELCAQVLNRR